MKKKKKEAINEEKNLTYWAAFHLSHQDVKAMLPSLILNLIKELLIL